MKSYRKQKMSLLFGSGLLLLLSYQNCSPPGSKMVLNSVNQEDASKDSEVRVVEDWDPEALAWADSNLLLHTETDSVTVEGICAEKNTVKELQWDLRADEISDSSISAVTMSEEQISRGYEDVTEEVLDSGFISCEGGGFALELSHLQSLICGVSYKLSIKRGEIESDLRLVRQCPI